MCKQFSFFYDKTKRKKIQWLHTVKSSHPAGTFEKIFFRCVTGRRQGKKKICWLYLALEKVGLSDSGRKDNFFGGCGEILSPTRLSKPDGSEDLNIKKKLISNGD